MEVYDEIFEFWVPGVSLTGVGVLGLAGNLLSVAVLSRPAMISSINILLLGLAFFDILLILTSILMVGIPSIHSHHMVMLEMEETQGSSSPIFNYYMQFIFPFITPLVYPIGMVCQTCSVYLTVCVSVERFIAVCFPLQAKHLCTQFRARLAVTATAILSLGYNLPRFWEVGVYSTQECESSTITTTNTSLVTCNNVTDVVQTAIRQDRYYIAVYMTWLYFVFMYILPFTLLAVFNLLIYNEIRSATRKRTTLTRGQRKEIGLAMMLFCVVAIFFICHILALVVNILEHFGKIYHPLTQTNNFLVTVNSSINFIIYCIFGDKFKRMVTCLLCSLIGREHASKHHDLIRYPSQYPRQQASCSVAQPPSSPSQRYHLTPSSTAPLLAGGAGNNRTGDSADFTHQTELQGMHQVFTISSHADDGPIRS